MMVGGLFSLSESCEYDLIVMWNMGGHVARVDELHRVLTYRQSQMIHGESRNRFSQAQKFSSSP